MILEVAIKEFEAAFGEAQKIISRKEKNPLNEHTQKSVDSEFLLMIALSNSTL